MTHSSLKAKGSSSEPPPRQAMRTSFSLRVAAAEIAAHSAAGASAPCPTLGKTTVRTCGERRASVVATSCSASPPSEVTTPTATGNDGSARFHGRIEQSFGFEIRAQAQEALVQRTRAGALHGLGDELQLASRLVDRDAFAQLHLLAIGRLEVEHRCGAPEHGATQDRGSRGVLEVEVAMTARSPRQTRDLAVDDACGDTLLDQSGDSRDQAADAPDACRGAHPRKAHPWTSPAPVPRHKSTAASMLVIQTVSPREAATRRGKCLIKLNFSMPVF